MIEVVFLGAGAAPGVPSLSRGWGECNPDNPKNRRSRTSTFYRFDNTRILVDTSPDLRLQLINNQITALEGVLYTHTHADHLHGIDDLREINRISRNSLNFYAHATTIAEIRERFSYLIAKPECANDVVTQPSLVANTVEHNQPFFINNLKITPIKLIGHNVPVTGYVFNDGEVVHIADFRAIELQGYEQIKQRPRLLVLPLTTPYGQKFHAGLEDVLAVIKRINPEQTIINHMASETDYDMVNAATPENVTPAYDNLKITL